MTATQPATSERRADASPTLFDAIARNVEQVIQGKPDVIELALVCLLSEGHLLIEDVPGVGKTSLAKALAASIDCTWKRVQFTPDLLPSDVVGVTVWNRGTERVRVPARPDLRQHRPRRRDQPGVAEDAVGAARGDGGAPGHRRRHDLSARAAVHGDRHAEPDRPRGHLPAAREPARPLPPAGLGRLPRPPVPSSRSSTRTPDHDTLDELQPVATAAEVRGDGRTRRAPSTSRPRSKGYLVDLAEASRRHPGLALGMSPRATLSPAARRPGPGRRTGRNYVMPDDVKALAGPVLAHRLVLTPEAQLQGADAARRRADVLARVPVPTSEVARAHPPGLGAPRRRRRRLRGRPALRHLRAVRRRRGARDPRASWRCCYVRIASPRLARAPHADPGAGPRRRRRPRRGARHEPRPPPHPGARAARSGGGHPGRPAPPRAAPPRRAGPRRLPTAHRPARRHRRSARSTVEVSDPVRPRPPPASRRAPARAHRVPARRRDPAAARTAATATRTAGGAPPNALGRHGEDFYALRPYVVGDDLRRVHWPSTARHDELMVRQDELPWQDRTTVLLDVRRAAPHRASRSSGRCRRRPASSPRPAAPAPPRRLVSTDGIDSGLGNSLAHVEAIMEYLATVDASGHGACAVLDRLRRSAAGGVARRRARDGPPRTSSTRWPRCAARSARSSSWSPTAAERPTTGNLPLAVVDARRTGPSPPAWAQHGAARPSRTRARASSRSATPEPARRAGGHRGRLLRAHRSPPPSASAASSSAGRSSRRCCWPPPAPTCWPSPAAAAGWNVVLAPGRVGRWPGTARHAGLLPRHQLLRPAHDGHLGRHVGRPRARLGRSSRPRRRRCPPTPASSSPRSSPCGSPPSSPTASPSGSRRHRGDPAVGHPLRVRLGPGRRRLPLAEHCPVARRRPAGLRAAPHDGPGRRQAGWPASGAARSARSRAPPPPSAPRSWSLALVVGPALPGAGEKALLDTTPVGSGTRQTVSPLVDIQGRIVDRSDLEAFTVAGRRQALLATHRARQVRRPHLVLGAGLRRRRRRARRRPPRAATAPLDQDVHDHGPRRHLAAGRVRARAHRHRRQRPLRRRDGEPRDPPQRGAAGHDLRRRLPGADARPERPRAGHRAAARPTSPTATSTCPRLPRHLPPAGRRHHRQRLDARTRRPRCCRTGSAELHLRPGGAPGPRRPTPSRASSRPAGATASSSPAPSPRSPARSASRRASPSASRRASCAPTGSTTCAASTPTPGPRCTSPASAGCRSSRRPSRGLPGAETYTGVPAAQEGEAPQAPTTTVAPATTLPRLGHDRAFDDDRGSCRPSIPGFGGLPGELDQRQHELAAAHRSSSSLVLARAGAACGS